MRTAVTPGRTSIGSLIRRVSLGKRSDRLVRSRYSEPTRWNESESSLRAAATVRSLRPAVAPQRRFWLRAGLRAAAAQSLSDFGRKRWVTQREKWEATRRCWTTLEV